MLSLALNSEKVCSIIHSWQVLARSEKLIMEMRQMNADLIPIISLYFQSGSKSYDQVKTQ